MKCPRCNGNGKILIYAYKIKCPKCNGTGEIDAPTNEQWFCKLATEEKAKWLNGLIDYCFGIGHICTSDMKKYDKVTDDPEEWLKQPHTVKE